MTYASAWEEMQAESGLNIQSSFFPRNLLFNTRQFLVLTLQHCFWKKSEVMDVLFRSSLYTVSGSQVAPTYLMLRHVSDDCMPRNSLPSWLTPMCTVCKYSNQLYSMSGNAFGRDNSAFLNMQWTVACNNVLLLIGMSC